jgi:hypothetical protein
MVVLAGATKIRGRRSVTSNRPATKGLGVGQRPQQHAMHQGIPTRLFRFPPLGRHPHTDYNFAMSTSQSIDSVAVDC